MSELAPDTIVFDSLHANTAIFAPISPPLVAELGLASLPLAGSVTDTQPIAAQPGTALGGYLVDGVNGGYLYGQIHVQPAVLDLGNLVSAQVRTVLVWNAQFVSADVESFVGENTEGITVTPPVVAPYTLAPLQEVAYGFSIAIDGPPQLDALYTLTIDGEEYTIEVVGVRTVLWPFGPNWNAPVDETLEWLTQVIPSQNGAEQRISLRSLARRNLEYDLSVVGLDETQRFDNLVWGWQNRPFAVPYWQYKCRTTAQASSGQAVVPVVTTDAGFAVGNLAVLIASPDVFEVFEIESVASNQIVAANNLAQTWAAGSAIYPVAVSRIAGNLPIRRETDRVLRTHVIFHGDPGLVDPFLPTAAASTTLNGLEVLLTRPDWQGGIDNPSEYPSDIIDFAVGRVAQSVTLTQPVQLKRYRWLLKNRAAVRQFREFLARRKGRHKAVYIPTWHSDLTLVQALTSGASSITAKDMKFFDLVGNDPSKAAVLIRTTSGDILRTVTSVGKTGNDLLLGLNTTLGVTLPLSAVKAVHFVSKYRLAADSVVIRWETNQVATVEASFQVVKA